jgi:hypothetical protein
MGFRSRRGGPAWMAVAIVLGLLADCATAPPQEPDNLCAIFREHHEWYEASVASSKRWGAPVHVPMAIIYQESGFESDARPAMRYFLGFIPYGRGSSAYGYSQAKSEAWNEYERETGWIFSSQDRDNFADAVDFVQWYIDKTHKINGVSKWDAYNQYLNYHEGRGGFARGSHKSNPALLKSAQKVDARARMYAAQYGKCRKELEKGWLARLFS